MGLKFSKEEGEEDLGMREIWVEFTDFPTFPLILDSFATLRRSPFRSL
jgi:hypothetical protein